MSWARKKIRSIPLRTWQTVIIGVGLGLFFVHLRHLTDEPSFLALLLGVLIPVCISIIVIVIGIMLRYRASLRPLAPWLTIWLVLAMVWMMVAGVGAVIYEQSEGVNLSHSMYLIVTFATYGCLPGLLTGWYDGRRRKHLRKVSEREDQLAVLSRILRHNLRNEMNVILGHSETLLEDETTSVDDHASKINESGQKLLELTEKERLLVEAVMDSPELTTVHLGQLLETVLTELRDEYPTASVSIDGNVNFSVRVAPNFERALREIIENAIVHNDSAVPEVMIRITTTGDSVRLRIQDNGPGIAEREANVVVGEQPISPLNHGSGMGFRLANLIIEQSGGTLELISDGEEGTEVPVTIQAA